MKKAAAEKTEFQRVLDAALVRFGQKQALAKAIGITPSRYSKLYAGNAYSLSVENCLKLAKITSQPPGDILRAANKADIAALIESLYGKPHEFDTHADYELSVLWPRLEDEDRAAIIGAVHALLRARRRDVAVPPRKTPAPSARQA